MAFEVSVFLENKITHFEAVTALLKKEEINIRSLSLSNMSHGWGVLSLLVDNPDRAYKLLTDHGHSVATKEFIALEMKDEAGGLDELLMKVARAGIHIESAYTRLIAERNMAVLLLEVPDILEAVRRLEINHVNILEDEVVYGK